jgi:Putative beta barrel porin-7 (BBP7)
MKRSTRIILAGVVALLLSAGMAAAQVATDGNLAYMVSNFQADNPTVDNSVRCTHPTDFQTDNLTANDAVRCTYPTDSEPLIVRNRLDSGCCWTASAEAMIMSRSGGKSSIMLTNAATGEELVNSNGFNFDWAAGPRVGIVGEDIFCCWDVDASYFGIDGWTTSKDIVAPDDGAVFHLFNQTPNPITFGVGPGDVVNYHYISRLHSAEINLRHPIWERVYFLMGFRNLELHEELGSTINDAPAFDVNVDNHLYGGQIGLNAAFINRCRWSIEGVIKAGVYGNSADLAMSAASLEFGQKTTHTAVQGEVGLMGIFQVTDHLSARLGYQAMWLDGIAIAGDQVESANPNDGKPYMGGTLFYHGATAGLEYAF